MAMAKKAITRIDATEAVAIISFDRASARIEFISALFFGLAREEINVDMISQTAPKGDCNAISFTVSDDSVSKVLAIINRIKQDGHELMPMISVGNVKISLFGENMPSLCGVAADVFVKLSSANIDTMLISTSEVDISIVVSPVNADEALELLKREYLGD